MNRLLRPRGMYYSPGTAAEVSLMIDGGFWEFGRMELVSLLMEDDEVDEGGMEKKHRILCARPAAGLWYR